MKRARRQASAGELSADVTRTLAKVNAPLELNASRKKSTSAFENRSFEGNLQALARWLGVSKQERGNRQLRYKDIGNSDDAKKAYHAVAHWVLKARQGVLAAEHRAAVIAMDFLYNETPIAEVLRPGPSIREA